MNIFPALAEKFTVKRHLITLALWALAAGLLWEIFDMYSTLPEFKQQWLASYRAAHLLVAESPQLAILAMFLIHLLLAALALPGASVIMLLAGASYGPLVGTLLCLSACTLGATLNMLVVRHFLQAFARRKLGQRFESFDQKIAADGAAYLFSLRMLPVIPFALVNVAAGLSSLRTWSFLWVSFVGMLAGTFVYVNAGSQLGQIQAANDLYSPQVILALSGLAFLPWLIKWFHQKLA